MEKKIFFIDKFPPPLLSYPPPPHTLQLLLSSLLLRLFSLEREMNVQSFICDFLHGIARLALERFLKNLCSSMPDSTRFDRVVFDDSNNSYARRHLRLN